MTAVRGRGRAEMGRLFGPVIATGGTNYTRTPHVPAAGFTRNVGRLLTRMLALFIGG